MVESLPKEQALSTMRRCPNCRAMPNIWRYLYNPPKKIAKFECSRCGAILFKSKGLSRRISMAIIVILALFFAGKPILQSVAHFTIFLSAVLVVLFVEFWVTEFTIVNSDTGEKSD